MKRNFLNKINIDNSSKRPIIINNIKKIFENPFKLKKSKLGSWYISELTVFIIVKIPILNEFSNSIPDIVRRNVMVNNDNINIKIAKKYLFISVILVFVFNSEILFK